jgi:hypothetical protein
MNSFYRIFLFIVLFSFSGAAFSQQGGNPKVEALRMDFISKRLDLSNNESDKFWPVYNEYNDKLRAIKRNLKQSFHQKSKNLNDGVAEELYQLETQSRQAELDVHKQYAERIKGIIGVKKLVLLRVAEEDFKKVLITTIQDKNE